MVLEAAERNEEILGKKILKVIEHILSIFISLSCRKVVI